MWEGLREDVEQMFEVLSDIFIEPEGGGFSFRIPNGKSAQLVRCAGCDAPVDCARVHSGKQWCSNRCKQRAKYKMNPWWKKSGAKEKQKQQRRKNNAKNNAA